MARSHDLGGVEGFGAIPGTDDDARFSSDWEARVFGLQRVLLACGLYSLDEFRDAVERLPPGHALTRSYYHRWMEAMISLLDERGVIDAGSLEAE